MAPTMLEDRYAAGSIARWLAADHARLDGLLQQARTGADVIDPTPYAEFRRGLLRAPGTGSAASPSDQRAGKVSSICSTASCARSTFASYERCGKRRAEAELRHTRVFVARSTTSISSVPRT